MSQLIFHIGLRKTGSSALQELLATQESILTRYNLSYPARLLNFPAHQEIAWVLFPKRPNYVKDLPSLDDVFSHYMTEIEKNANRGFVTILSSEDLSLLSLNFTAISNLRRAFLKYKPKIVYFYRNPLDYLVSNYQHAVLRGRETRSFREVCFKTRNLVFADRKLIHSIWVDAFGEESVLPIAYDPEKLKSTSILSQFLQAIIGKGLESEGEEFINYRSNSGVSTAAARYVRYLNSSDLADSQIRKVVNTIVQFDRADTKDAFLKENLTTEERMIIEQIFS